MKNIFKGLLFLGATALTIGVASCATKSAVEATSTRIAQIAKEGEVTLELTSTSKYINYPESSETGYEFYFKSGITTNDLYTSGSLTGKTITSVTFYSKTDILVTLSGTAATTVGWGAIVLAQSGWDKGEIEVSGGSATQFVWRCVVDETSSTLGFNEAVEKVGTSFDILDYIK